MSVSVSGTTDQKTYLKKFRGGFIPLSPPWIRLWNLVIDSLQTSRFQILSDQTFGGTELEDGVN